jgi:hypothetical protein
MKVADIFSYSKKPQFISSHCLTEKIEVAHERRSKMPATQHPISAFDIARNLKMIRAAHSVACS